MSGSMVQYSELYLIKVGESRYRIEDADGSEEFKFDVSKKEINALEKKLRKLGFYKIETEPIELMDGNSRTVEIVYSDVSFKVESNAGEMVSEQFSEDYKACIKLIIDFCHEKAGTEP